MGAVKWAYEAPEAPKNSQLADARENTKNVEDALSPHTSRNRRYPADRTRCSCKTDTKKSHLEIPICFQIKISK